MPYPYCCGGENVKTVHEVEALTGVSVRTLRYYDQIGLLKPSALSDAGYRLYDDDALDRLQQILLYRELQFPLKDVARMLDSPAYDRSRALGHQAQLLTLKKERLEKLIDLTRRIQIMGGRTLDFSAFDSKKIDEYSALAREKWGDTEAYREFEEKHSARSRGEELRTGADMMQIFSDFGALPDRDPASDAAQALVKQLRDFITANYYDCTPQILAGLGAMYAAEGEMRDNIDRAGGSGTAVFAAEAVRIYCEQN